MGLAEKMVKHADIIEGVNIEKSNPGEKIIALAGNPNVGKSTVFNALTGLRQHTGNWSGKTVENARGKYSYNEKEYILVDVPGAYSLMASSAEEEVARDFICFGNHDAVVVVADATCLERNLNLILQIREACSKTVICVNLLDEAEKKNIKISLDALSDMLKTPVVGVCAAKEKGLNELKKVISEIINENNNTEFKIDYSREIEGAIKIIEPAVKKAAGDKLSSRWLSLRLLDLDKKMRLALEDYLGYDILSIHEVDDAIETASQYLIANGVTEQLLQDDMVGGIIKKAAEIYNLSVICEEENYNRKDRKIDKILTSKIYGIPIMCAFLALIFWITIVGANYPSSLLNDIFFRFEDWLVLKFELMNAPQWVIGLFVLGIYRTMALVVSVMLPPMAIFFPLFTLLEDFGYLPRIAFNLDGFFKRAGAHGKQVLTMCMGFGCNVCGVMGCRIIESPRERLIAILTNNFVPCNGRFPTLISIITMFFAYGIFKTGKSIISTLLLTAVILLGVLFTLLISKLLSKTILKGLPSSFVLELPPYRLPQLKQVIVRSVMDRTLFVLGRAISVAAPAGLVIWLMANVMVNENSLLSICAAFLNPFAQFIGLDGIILIGFILGFPANEIVMPIIIMGYMATGDIIGLDNLEQLRLLLVQNGWTWLTALCTMLFTLMHFPCGTTCLTIKKETGSLKWTLAAFLIPTIAGIIVCAAVASSVRLLGLV